MFVLKLQKYKIVKKSRSYVIHKIISLEYENDLLRFSEHLEDYFLAQIIQTLYKRHW